MGLGLKETNIELQDGRGLSAMGSSIELVNTTDEKEPDLLIIGSQFHKVAARISDVKAIVFDRVRFVREDH